MILPAATAPAPRGLGKFEVCTSPMYGRAENQLRLMRTTFDQLLLARRIETAEWAPAVIALEQAFDAIGFSWLGFSSTYCQARDVGNQAEALTGRMLEAANRDADGEIQPVIQPVPALPSGGGFSWMPLLLVGGGALGALFLASKFLRSH